MQIQIFKISLADVEGLEMLNVFLRSHRILEVQQEFVGNVQEGYWNFCIRYLKSERESSKFTESKKSKIDYREVLDEVTFKVFAALRVCHSKCRRVFQTTANFPLDSCFLYL